MSSTLRTAAIISAFLSSLAAQAAHASTMDCKVILCMAGGFPSPECSDAYDHMVDRVTSFPPKSPFGICTMSGGGEYEGYDVSFRRYTSGDPERYICPDGSFVHINTGIDDPIPGPATCHNGMWTETRMDTDGDIRTETRFANPRRPEGRLDYIMRITVEPGQENEYVSPVMRGSFSGGILPD